MGVLILARDEVRVRLAAQSPAAALPVLTYSDAITIHLNGEEVYAFSVPPAHTDGDTFIHFMESDVIHAGDVFRTTAFLSLTPIMAAASTDRCRLLEC